MATRQEGIDRGSVVRAGERLAIGQLYTRCDPAQFRFATTDEVEPLDTFLGQPRASEALRFGIGIRRPGYNLYALGPPGVGKRSVVGRFLVERAAREARSDDLCYVHNFDSPHRPSLLRLPAGVGERLRRDIDRTLEEMRGAITAAFESEEYRTRRHKLEEELKQAHEGPFEALARDAQAKGIALLRTPGGFMFAPIRHGQPLDHDAFLALPPQERERINETIGALQERLQFLVEQLQQASREGRERLRALEREITAAAVRHLIDELRRAYAEFGPVLAHLDKLERAIVDHSDDFRPGEEQPRPFLFAPMAGKDVSPLRRYRVNVLVDRSEEQGAPVVQEDNPIHQNLIGRIEHIAQLGALVTDFMLIKAGALHRANGGYLILDARKLLMQPFAWEALKRALRANEIRIEMPGQEFMLVSTVSLEPEPAPLDLKVILLGDRLIYYLLCELDPDFPELFKVAADFEDDMPRDASSQHAYARLIAALVRKERLRPFDRAAIARVIEHGARVAEDGGRLTLQVREITDLLREADYWAHEAGRPTASADDVERALEAKIYRHDRVRERVQQEIERGVLLIDTRGERVGQLNALSVSRLGGFAFGRPTRITARARLGKGEVVDIQREVKLGGPIHSKGVLTLAGFVAGRYLRDRPLSVSASVVFEQTYDQVEGDSASCAELCALLSVFADAPIRQSLAVTGSVNQHGQVQAIGSVNEKIEGFFDVCRREGLTGEQGVIIPASNVRHLMLRADVVTAAAQSRFHVYPVETVDQAMELLTGTAAGSRDASGAFPKGSINQRVEARLSALAEEARLFYREGAPRVSSRTQQP